ncbi:MAG: hypothetical protein ACLGHL_06260 [Actinomycetota bacterium]
MVTGYIVPHAPVLVAASPAERPSLHLGAALRVLVQDPPDLVVICSPHGSTTGVYASASGDLAGHGLPDVATRREVSPSSEVLASAWSRPLITDPADHGIVVPVALAAIPDGTEVVACCLEEWTGQDERSASTAIEAGASLAEALKLAFEGRKVAYVASAHGSAALSPRAPLTERPEGIELERRLHAAFLSGVEQLSGIGAAEWEEAGCCGAGPLIALAHLVRGPAELLAYDAPFGVGYFAARWTGSA